MRLPLISSMALHGCFLLALFFVTIKQVMPPSGVAPITVHLATQMSLPISHSTEAIEKPVVKKKIVKTAAKPEEVVKATEAKPTEATGAKAASNEKWQEAKSENTGPKILFQPMPKIPDDLRHEALSAWATVRFHVAENGEARAELLVPSQNPRLNHLLLDALKSWKFAPAEKNGVKVESDFEIRVHFAVE